MVGTRNSVATFSSWISPIAASASQDGRQTSALLSIMHIRIERIPIV